MPYPVNFYTLTLSISTLIELSNGIYLTAIAVNPEVVKKSPRLNATGAVSGVITTPDVSFIQNSLAELPSNQLVVEVRCLFNYPLQSCAMITTFTSNRKYKLKQLTWHKLL
jgi:hypothetical protein